MKVSFYITKRMEAEVNDKYKILFDNSTISAWEWKYFYDELVGKLYELPELDGEETIEEINMEEE